MTLEQKLPTSTVTLIRGDGIGHEIMPILQQCVEATGAPIIWEPYDAGETSVAQGGKPLPDELLESIRKNKVAIKGPTGTPIGMKGHRSVNVALRQELDLYACVRPIKFYEGVPTRVKDPESIDFTIIRENTEDLYAGIEFAQGNWHTMELITQLSLQGPKMIAPDSALAIKPISVSGSDRIIRYAFEYAKKHSKTQVTAVTKANIMKFTDGLFLERAREVAKEYPSIKLEEMLVDNANMQLTTWPERFQVMVMPNLYGDILSDHAAGVVGGLGIAPGANIGEKYALFEAVHGTAPDIAGQGEANPTAILFSGAMMLEHMGYVNEGRYLQQAVATVLKEGKYTTGDLRSREQRKYAASTTGMGNAVIFEITKLRAQAATEKLELVR
jgi:isocitrate dehydrogenase (NAD+)